MYNCIILIFWGGFMENNIYFKKIDELYEKYLQVWQDVCDIESPSEFKAGVDACGDYFVKMAKELGFSVEKKNEKDAGNPICITMNPNAKGSPISFSGHIDTVHPVGSFGTPPTRIDDEKIYGPGVFDCKGGIVGAMFAMEALQKCGYTDRPIQLLIQTDEEIGSRNSGGETIKWICEKAKESVAFLNVEPSVNKDLCIQRKGGAMFKFKIKGIEAHSANCAVSGANAIFEAAQKINLLEQLKDDEALTYSCNTISGGSAANTVAGYCEFVCDVRFANNEQYNEAVAKIEEVKNMVFVKGCTTEVEQLNRTCALPLTDANLKLANTLNSVFEKYGLERLQILKRGGASDAAHATEFGLTTVDALGVEGGNMHSVKEFAFLESLKKCAKQNVAIVLEIN